MLRRKIAVASMLFTCTAAHAEMASVYPDRGERACPGHYSGFTIAHRTWRCGHRVRLTRGNRSIVATVNDRGPFKPRRDIDLPLSTARALGFDDGVESLKVTHLDNPS